MLLTWDPAETWIDLLFMSARAPQHLLRLCLYNETEVYLLYIMTQLIGVNQLCYMLFNIFN